MHRSRKILALDRQCETASIRRGVEVRGQFSGKPAKIGRGEVRLNPARLDTRKVQQGIDKLQQAQAANTFGIGGAFIGNRRASTCNGANLAYRKDVFYEVGGFKGIDDLASGDDELLLQKVAQRFPGRIGFLKCYDATVFTHAKHTLKEFLQQRRRWASKSVKYKDKKVVAFVVCIWLFNVSLVVNLCLGLFNVYFFKLVALQFLLKYVFELAYLLPISTFFKRPALVALLIIIIPVHVIYFIYIGLIGNSGTYIWRGREVR